MRERELADRFYAEWCLVSIEWSCKIAEASAYVHSVVR